MKRRMSKYRTTSWLKQSTSPGAGGISNEERGKGM